MSTTDITTNNLKIVFGKQPVNPNWYENTNKTKIVFGKQPDVSDDECSSGILKHNDFTCKCFLPYIDSNNITISCGNLTLFTSDIYVGESVDFDFIRTTEAKIEHGESVSVDITFARRVNFNAAVEHGEHIKLNEFNIAPSFNSNSSYGESVNYTLHTSTSHSSNIFHGEELSSSITYTKAITFDFDVYHGEAANFNISLEQHISTSLLHGEDVNVEIEINPPQDLVTLVEHGESVNFNIANDILFNTTSEHGEDVNAEIEINPSYEVNSILYNGESVTGNISLSPTLDGSIEHGEVVYISGAIKNHDNYYLYNGESVTGNISLSPTLDGSIEHGERVNGNIEYNENEPVVLKSIEHGEVVDFNIAIQRSITFSANIIHGMSFTPTPWVTSNIDLNRFGCCNYLLKDDLQNISLSNDHEVSLSYENTIKTSVIGNLTMVRLFDAQIEHGEQFNVIEYDNYFTADIFHGEESTIHDIYMDLNIDLSGGNIQTDDIIIETDKDYQVYNSSFSNSYHGESVSFELSVSNHWYGEIEHGEEVRAELAVIEAIRVRLGLNYNVYAEISTDVKFNSDINHGEETAAKIYSEPWIIGHGEEVRFDININYDVEFIDEGCLDNTHIEIDKDGVPIFNIDQGVNIEGHYYSHYIKGRCY